MKNALPEKCSQQRCRTFQWKHTFNSLFNSCRTAFLSLNSHQNTDYLKTQVRWNVWGRGKGSRNKKNWQMTVCFLMPIYTSSEKRPLISDHIKGPLVAAFSSPLMNALDRSVKTLGLRIVTSSVTFIKSVNQSSIKPYQTGRHLVWQNTNNIISWDKQTNCLKSYSPIFLLFFVTILFTHVKNIVIQIMN